MGAGSRDAASRAARCRLNLPETTCPAERTVILDACCVLNLAATGRAEAILAALPWRFVVGERARREALWLRVPESEDRKAVDLAPWLELGVLEEVSLRAEAERVAFVEICAALAEGEAEALALASCRGYVLATDDRKARRVALGHDPSTRLTGSLELLREWQQSACPSGELVSASLRRIAERATFRPNRNHPLYDWWRTLVEEYY